MAKDKSLRGLIDSGSGAVDELEELAEFREWLIELREDNDNRMETRRDGTTKMRENGELVYGPFKLEVRKEILKKLLALSKKIDKTLISSYEVGFIEEIWRIDEIQEKGRETLMKSIASTGA